MINKACAYLATALIWLGASLTAEPQRPVIFAAASLSEALTAATQTLDPAPRLSFGGSGTIARQIAQGAPADMVLLASPVWMQWLESGDHLLAGTRRTAFGNRLVLVGPPGAMPLETLTQTSLRDRLGPTGRLAMGEHRAVPAGQYAAAWLQTKGLWDSLRPALAETENVRAALALVSRAEVPLALVYASDLVAAPQAATRVWTIPTAEQPDIRYELAAITARGVALSQALMTPEALAIFAEFGFQTDLSP